MKSEIPPNADVLEVRDTLTLPFGIVPLDGRIYFLMTAQERNSLAHSRKLAVTDVHPCGKLNRSHFADSELGVIALGRSNIIKPKHIAGLIRVCGGKPPQLGEMLYSGSKNGFMSTDFHRHCDHKGPTLAIVRNAAPYNRIFGCQSRNGRRLSAVLCLFSL
jgi:hypothetical protein